jgi:hypothetical protein
MQLAFRHTTPTSASGHAEGSQIKLHMQELSSRPASDGMASWCNSSPQAIDLLLHAVRHSCKHMPSRMWKQLIRALQQTGAAHGCVHLM